jgi:uncharacterized Zn-binding protein involved in type VI secretion
MKRHHVILGTKTTAGGEVISAGSTRSLNGVNLALEGDKIYCPACKSEGVIRCHGPRLSETWNGINFALEHDLCICRCKTPPTLLAAQSFSSQTVDGSGFGSNGKPPTEVLAEPVAPKIARADSGLCLDCLIKAAAAGSSTVIRG